MIDIFIVTKLSEGLFFNCIKSITEKTSDAVKQLLRLNICYTGEDKWQMDTITEKCAELHLPCRVWTQEYNFSKCNNMMVKLTDGEYLLFMNDDIELIDDCISHCYEVCKTKKFGTVGCKLLYPDGTILHAGQEIYLDLNYNYIGASHYLLKQPNRKMSDIVSFGNTGAFLMIEREIFPYFNEKYEKCFEDIEFNLLMLLTNRLNVTCCSVDAYHRESKTRGRGNDYFSEIDINLAKDFVNNNIKSIGNNIEILSRTIHVKG